MRTERLSRVLRKFVEEKSELKAAKKGIGQVEKILGRKGENWIRYRINDGEGNFCLLGAIEKANMPSSVENIVSTAIQGSIPGNNVEGMDFFSTDNDEIAEFNDSVAKEWSSVQEVLKRAKKAIANAMKSERSLYA